MIYVIKENRTYDQVLGSLGKGNGDPSLNLFGDESAPNQRELARRFVTLDNFYVDGEVTFDGWFWDTAALANTFVQKSWPQAASGRNRPAEFAVPGIGSAVGNFAMSPGKDPADAFIWDKLSDAGIRYRNYGFAVRDGKVASTELRLAQNTDLNFAGSDLTKPDAVPDLFGTPQPTRIGEWLREFNQYVANANLPTVEFVRLANDHTFGSLAGRPTPRAYMADNDLALGKLVDAVSHSPYWPSTAIFVVEDDAQDGPDHVDAHRTVAQVISPYTQTGKVDSTFYSTVSMLRTMERIVGIPPMTQFDAAATPMTNSFTDEPNFRPYTAITPTQNVHEKNPAPNPLTANPLFAQVTAADFAHEDMVEPQLLNRMIWQSIKGEDSEMPAPHTRFGGGQQRDADDELHPGPQGDGTGVTTEGWLLTPAGKQVRLGDRPYGLALSPDGQTLLVSNDGKSTQSLMVIDAGTGTVVQTLSYKSPEALNLGVAFSPDGRRAYASAGGNNKIRVYDVSGQRLTEKAPLLLPLPVGPDGKPVNLFPAGLTLSADGGTLYVADNLGDRMSVVNLATGAVKTIPVGHNPYTVALSHDGRTAYVSNWGDTTVSVVDVSGGIPRVVGTLRAGTHPSALALNPHNSELYVANADSDDVSVFDTTSNQLLRTIDLRPFPGAKVGSSPNALVVSPDGRTLYVANATDNDVAVVRLGDAAPRGKGRTPDRVEGLIPTAWFPAGVAVSPDGEQLYVINGKGLGAGPNPRGPSPYRDPGFFSVSSDDQYVGSMMVGTLSIIDVPNPDQLRRYTRQVFENDRFGREVEDRARESARQITPGNEWQHRGDDDGGASERSTLQGPGEGGSANVRAALPDAVQPAPAGTESGASLAAALTSSAGQPTTPATLPAATPIAGSAAPLVPVGETGADPLSPDVPAVAAAAASGALFADPGNDLWHETGAALSGASTDVKPDRSMATWVDPLSEQLVDELFASLVPAA